MQLSEISTDYAGAVEYCKFAYSVKAKTQANSTNATSLIEIDL